MGAIRLYINPVTGCATGEVWSSLLGETSEPGVGTWRSPKWHLIDILGMGQTLFGGILLPGTEWDASHDVIEPDNIQGMYSDFD